MTHISRRSTLVGAALAAIVGAAGMAGASGSADGPLRCEIRKSAVFGMTALEAVVHADEAMSGSYRFTVKGSGGGTNIRQSGAFSVAPGQPATLGKVSVAGSAAYDASLSVTADGMSAQCDERFGAI